ncbi:MAG TPA: glycosyltransferase family 39 protein [Pyrinomonadaceae bacterium]|nr:glycosyltransferase family 39 protein [Pyrinomonadaceae bacterium]
MSEKLSGRFKRNSSTLIYAGTGILSALLLSVITSRLLYPFDTGNYEAFNWQPAQHLLAGKNPYSFALTPPYSMTPYGIVFYALLAIGVELFGLQLSWGRILSVAAFAACLWAVVKITKIITRSKEASLVALLAGLAAFPAEGWVAVVRPDLIALAFSLAALYLVFNLKDDRSNLRGLAGAVLLSAAAFFTKQTFLLVVAVGALRLLQLRKWREAVWLVSAFAVLAGVGIFFLNYTSSGGYVWQHFIHARRLPFSPAQSLYLVVEMLKLPTVMIFVLSLLILAYRRREALRGPSSGRLSDVSRSPKALVVFYFLLSFAWSFLSSGRAGASFNYYLENSLVMAICFALIYDSFKRNGLQPAASVMVVLLTCGGAFQLARVSRGEYFRWQALSYYREIYETAAALTPPDGVCVSVYAELVVRNGCQLHFGDFGEYVGGWSPELGEIFERELKAGRYSLIIWNRDDLQSQFPNYQLLPMSQSPPERFSPVYLYVRRGPASAPVTWRGTARGGLERTVEFYRRRRAHYWRPDADQFSRSQKAA